MKLYENSLYAFTLEENSQVLRFDWTDKTQDMTYEDFQEACSNYAGFVIEHDIKKLFVDTRQFQFQLPEEFLSWRETELNPRYHRIGVEKFAYLMPTGASAGLEDQVPEDGTFVTSYFESEDQAKKWLMAS